jgi:hypothetical protein
MTTVDKVFTKTLSSKRLLGGEPISAARHVLFACRAVHQQLSSMAQSYPQVQRFLAEGSYRALGKL